MEAARAWLHGTEAKLVGLTLLTKVALFVWGLVVVSVVRGDPFDIGQIFEIWNRWDAPHYLDLATWGYMAVDPGVTPTYGQTGDMDLMIVFYPLFPGAISAALLVLPDLVAPIAVSTVASLFAVVLLYRVVARELGPEVGVRAAVFLLIFPTAYFLHIGYTESLFLALVLGSFLAAAGGRWWMAGLLGGLSALTRVNGLMLIPSLIADTWTTWRTTRRLEPAWGWIGLVAVGFGGYLLLNLAVYGDPLAFIRIQNEHWFKTLAWPWVGIGGVVDRLDSIRLEEVAVLGVAELVAIGLGLAGTVVAALRFRPSWAVWMAGNWILFVSTAFVLSVPRYDLAMFPLFAWFGLMAERRWLGVSMGAVSVILLLWFSARFALGTWAF
jgi:Mannosyltransferase (PIG-V)